ncbi:hypothetical protein E1B28_002131 [Marasmius oreades]|uniref:CxC2-like cysteine cluster KDZ transposase-associated domain-containing protein n=1 Tax=Marasmius oreades TaxID=181124 RepID=A0A9P7RMG7_9AGAR|nr:uncharacterized protein E1B28_002131 [Marasmius oreades]KAG7086172.1 hypothetical protein E1B28_002131 [Marasmius oreades]
MASSRSPRKKGKRNAGIASTDEFNSIPAPQFQHKITDSAGQAITHDMPIQAIDQDVHRPLKRPRSWTTLSDNQSPSYIPEGGVKGTNEQRPSIQKGQGASVHMEGFKQNLHVIIDYLLLQESSMSVGEPCKCRRPGAVRSCICFDCLFFEPSCSICFLETHSSSPLHWAHVWNGKFYDKRDICDLGYVYTFSHNHNGCRCEAAEAGGAYSKPLDFNLIDINGIHRIKCVFCACPGHGRPEHRFTDLLASGIFPATVARAETGFTFNVLSEFHLHTVTSKKSPYDFVYSLRLRTCGFSPDLANIPDPYQQFLRVQRIFRVAQAVKRSGHAHGMDQFFPNRPPGSVVVPCFACPEPGFNVPDHYWNEIDDDFLHMVQLTMMVDGHFGLQRFAKVDDPDDVSLLDGLGFFPRDEEYNEYVGSIVLRPEDEKSTCSHLHAVDMQNKLKFKGCVITGVVAVECGRHSVFMSMVDLQKGERFSNADFAFIRAVRRYVVGTSLVHARFFRRILSTYDIACQFGVHFFQRTAKHFPDMAWLIDFVRWMVPKMHLDGHNTDCRIRFSLNYLKGAARMHGEGIEQSWAESKQSGGSTRQMNHGHRHDTIIDLHNFWNWTKAMNMATYLTNKHSESVKLRDDAIEHYIGLSRLRGAVNVDHWSKESDEPKKEGDHWVSVYHIRTRRLPSRENVYMNMLSLEQENLAARGDLFSDASDEIKFILSGIRIQERQRQLQASIRQASTESEISTTKRSKTVLTTDIRNWRKLQLHMMPQVESFVSAQLDRNNDISIETQCLYLPSDFSQQERKKLSLDLLSSIELKLREGECNDAIVGLCDAINYKTVMRENQRANSHGVIQNTRSVKWLKTAEVKKQLHATHYRASRLAILGLLGIDDSPDYPVLKDEDMYAKNPTVARELGDGKRVDAWIWRYGQLKGLGTKAKADFLTEMERVQWFRAKADMERLVEEVELLEEEFRCLTRACRAMTSYWSQLAVGPPNLEKARYPLSKSIAGITDARNPYRVYASHKAALYASMAKDAEEKFYKAAGPGCWPSDNQNLNDYFRSRRPVITLDSDN